MILAVFTAAVIGPIVAIGTVKVNMTTFRQWDNAVEVKNDSIRLVFVPQIGRIMFFGRVNGPNLLWVNSAVNPGDAWVNWGGDKLWPAPQSRWNWPPDKDLDGSRWSVDLTPDGFTTVSPVSVTDGIRFKRTVRMSPTRLGVEITNTLEKLAGEPTELSIWQIAQLDNPTWASLPYQVRPNMPNGYAGYDQQDFSANTTVVGNRVQFRRHPSINIKFGSAGSTGLLQANVRGTTFNMQADYREGERYPDDGKAQQIYLNANPLAYAELELTRPLRLYSRGDESSFTARWQISN